MLTRSGAWLKPGASRCDFASCPAGGTLHDRAKRAGSKARREGTWGTVGSRLQDPREAWQKNDAVKPAVRSSTAFLTAERFSQHGPRAAFRVARSAQKNQAGRGALRSSLAALPARTCAKRAENDAVKPAVRSSTAGLALWMAEPSRPAEAGHRDAMQLPDQAPSGSPNAGRGRPPSGSTRSVAAQ